MPKITIEIADNPAALARGLMLRKSLDKNHGMLFKFPMVIEASFWGKDTYLPLDIAFVNSDGIINGIKSITPMSTRAVRSDSVCSMAIETNSGFFNENKIKVGHKIEIIKDPQGKETEIIFKTND